MAHNWLVNHKQWWFMMVNAQLCHPIPMIIPRIWMFNCSGPEVQRMATDNWELPNQTTFFVQQGSCCLLLDLDFRTSDSAVRMESCILQPVGR